jgi:hypothetical protein
MLQDDNQAPPQRRRPLGIGDAVAQKLIAALEADVGKNAADVIQTVRQDRPVDYLKIVLGLVPNEVPADDASLKDLPDESLFELVRALQAIDARRAADGAGGGQDQSAGAT